MSAANPDPTVELDVTVLRVRPDSITVEFCEEVIILPRSQIETLIDIEACGEGDLVTIELPEWLAIHRGMV